MTPKNAVEFLNLSEYGEHDLLVYSTLDEFRQIYSRYCKSALEENSELVLLIPHCETVNAVRKVLTKKSM